MRAQVTLAHTTPQASVLHHCLTLFRSKETTNNDDEGCWSHYGGAHPFDARTQARYMIRY